MRTGMTIRRWLVVIAAVALGLGVANESYYQNARTRFWNHELRQTRYAERREREHAFCLEQQIRGIPYDAGQRVKLLEADPEFFCPSLWPESGSWGDEAKDHADWAQSHREGAQVVRMKRLAVERRVIFH